jgi:hypothetical protein
MISTKKMQLVLKSPAKMAGLLSLLSTMFVMAIWFILLFVGTPANQTITQAAINQVVDLYSADNPSRLTFLWLAVLPIITAAIGAAYLLNLARTKLIASALLVFTCAMGLIVLAFGPFSLAIFVLLPAYWGWKCLENIQKFVNSDG